MASCEFRYAVEDGDLDTVRRAVEADATLSNAELVDGDRPLHRAAHHGYREMALFLLNHGADVRAAGCDGMTPLHHAIDSIEPDIVELLIKNGADLDALDHRGLSPLACAARKWCVVDGLEEEKRVFHLLQESSAGYDLAAACMMVDISRVRAILEEDPSAVKRLSVCATGYLLAPMIFHEWGTFERKAEILELLFENEFQPPVEEVAALCSVATSYGPAVRNLTDRLKAHTPRSS